MRLLMFCDLREDLVIESVKRAERPGLPPRQQALAEREGKRFQNRVIGFIIP